MVPAANREIADFALTQYYGTGLRRPEEAKASWQGGLFLLAGRRLDYYDYVRAALSGGSLHFDPVREIADNSTGALIYQATYSAYGSIESETGSGGDRYKYTGQEYISEANVYYYDNRIYTAFIGRFNNEDPIWPDDHPNPFAYVRNAPTNATDPTGLAIYAVDDAAALAAFALLYKEAQSIGKVLGGNLQKSFLPGHRQCAGAPKRSA